MLGKVVNCPCGAIIRADSDDELVKLVGKHSQEVHNQEVPSKEEVLAMAQPD